MNYQITQRDDDVLAFNLIDPDFTGDSPDPALRKAFAECDPSEMKEANRLLYASAYVRRFKASEPGQFLADTLDESDYEFDGKQCLEYGPLILRFKRKDHAALFKLSWHGR